MTADRNEKTAAKIPADWRPTYCPNGCVMAYLKPGDSLQTCSRCGAKMTDEVPDWADAPSKRPMCNFRRDVWQCTLLPGHSGDHVCSMLPYCERCKLAEDRCTCTDLEVWQHWFRESGAAAFWAGVDDIEAELGRHDDEVPDVR